MVSVRSGSEEAVLLAQGSQGADVADGEGDAPVAFVAQSDIIAAILHADAAAVGIVSDLGGGILDYALAVVVHGIEPHIDALAVGIAESRPEVVLVGGGRQRDVVVDLVVADQNVVLLPAVVGGKGAVDDGAIARVVIGLPLDAEAGDRTGAHQGHDRRRAARSHQKGIGGKIGTGGKDVALAGDEGAAEGFVEVALLHQLPGEDFDHGIAALGVDPVGERESQVVGIGEEVGFVETDEAVEIAADAGHVVVGDPRLDDMFELVAEDGLFREDAGQRGKDQVERKIAGAADDVGAHDAHIAGIRRIGSLGFAVKRLLKTDAGDQAETAPVQGTGEMGREAHAVGELAGFEAIDQGIALKERLRTEQQASGGIEGEPQGHVLPDLVVPLGQLGFRQLSNGHGVGQLAGLTRYGIGVRNLGGLIVLQPAQGDIEGVVHPVLGEGADRVDFRADHFGVRFRPLLPEIERGDVVGVPAGGPAVSQVGLADDVEAQAAVGRRVGPAAGHAAVLHAVQDGIEIRAGLGLAAEIHVMGEGVGGEVLESIGEVVAAVDGPIISQPDHEAALGVGRDIGKEKAAAARLLIEGAKERGSRRPPCAARPCRRSARPCGPVRRRCAGWPGPPWNR